MTSTLDSLKSVGALEIGGIGVEFHCLMGFSNIWSLYLYSSIDYNNKSRSLAPAKNIQ